MHIDSPGGSALASDRIHHELEQLAREKPVVAYFSNVAASGGYYIGAAAHEIIAQPTTITGSIGVVGLRVVVQPLLEKLGIKTEVLTRGRHARMLDPTLPFDEKDNEAMERELSAIYQAFVAVVARGRKKSTEQVEEVAQGRVWTGADALKNGLVDKLGGFEEALAALRARIGPEAEKLEPVMLRPRKPRKPLDPPEQKAAAFLASLLGVDLAPLLLRERGLTWSPEANELRD
jgi:protease-4